MKRRRQLSVEEARARLEDMCVRSEQCVADLRQKLVRFGVDFAKHDEIIEALKKAKFVDDARFARAYVRDKYRFDRWGRMKIVRGLMAKRIDRTVINEALGEIDMREYTLNCFRLLRAKLKTFSPETERYEAKQKLLRFGAARGYEASLLIKLINSEKLWISSTE